MATKQTKKQMAINLFNKGCDTGKTRQQILAQLRVRLDMTDAAAKTYYQKIACGAWM